MMSCRHTWATTMMNEDVSLAYISRGLGHTSLATTSNYLDKFRDRKIKKAGGPSYEIYYEPKIREYRLRKHYLNR